MITIEIKGRKSYAFVEGAEDVSKVPVAEIPEEPAPEPEAPKKRGRKKKTEEVAEDEGGN